MLLLLGGASLWAAERPDLPLADFEGPDYGAWQASGEAFGRGPTRAGASTEKVTSFVGQGFAWSHTGGPTATGELLSPEFTLERRYLNFLVAGERDRASVVGAELLVRDRVVRSASATGARSGDGADPALYWRTWDVAELAGQRARVRLNDHSANGTLKVDAMGMSDTARTTPSDSTALMHESLRPQFHYTAQVGWLNDPNGLVYYQGTWHLFHQYSPPGLKTGGWGHATSPDLVHWRHGTPPMWPDEGDSHSSGSGAVDWQNTSGLKSGKDAPLLLFYTLRHPGPKLVTEPVGERSTQDLAYSLDGGKTWQKYAGNPLVRTPDFRDRDPKVFYHAPTRAWYMVLSLSRNNVGRDHASYGVFRSTDLKAWKLLQEIGSDRWYWECPDMFELPIDGDASRPKWLLLNGAGNYRLGSFDEHGFHPETEPITNRWGGGGNYYALQTFNDAPGGRRVQIGWMSTHGTESTSYPGMPFNQQISFPRDLTLRSTPAGPRLFRYPVPEIKRLYTRTHDLAATLLGSGQNPLAALKAELLDLELEIELGQATQVRLELRGQPVVYDVARQKLTAGEVTAPLTLEGNRLTLRALLDRTSLEVFANEGEVDIASVFYPRAGAIVHSLTATGPGARLVRGAAHELKSIWPEGTVALVGQK